MAERKKSVKKNASEETRQRLRRRIKRRRQANIKDSKLGMSMMIAVVVVFCAVMIIKTLHGKETLYELDLKGKKLTEELQNEELRNEELEEKRVYVQTKMYVEEIAKKLGLVYPDEIIYKPNKD